MTAGSNATYSILTLQPLPVASSGSETVALSSTAPPGLALTLTTNLVNLTTDARAFVGMRVTSSQSATPGDYKVTVVAKYGTSSTMTYDVPVKVVQYLVIMQNNVLHPSNLTVKQGSTIYWMNMDAPADSAGGMPGSDPEIHDVDFLSGSSAESPDLMLYSFYSFTLTDPGTYLYHCSFHPLSMHGIITVTSG
jgi:plastocyanin